MEAKSLFTQIIERKIPAEIVYENEHVIAIKDIYPVAPVHLLIITKKQIPNIQSLQENDYFLLAEIVKTAQHLADEFEVEEGYRLLTNNGEEAGQSIFHLHFHLIGGKVLGHLA